MTKIIEGLIPGNTYKVEWNDCCVQGFFVGEFVEIHNPRFSDACDHITFTTGIISGGHAFTVTSVEE